MNTKIARSTAASLMLSALATTASATLISPTSYDLLNGNSGSYNYWDDSYDGNGNNQVNGAALSGGTGDLTDGIIATQNWNLVEAPRGPNGPYVGWVNINPTINFHFGSVVDVSSITIYTDDSNGTGGVSAPLSVTINGTNFSITDPTTSDPLVLTFDNLAINASDIDITFYRRNSWVFVSEISFDDATTTAVPIPATAWLFGSGLIGLVSISKRKKTA